MNLGLLLTPIPLIALLVFFLVGDRLIKIISLVVLFFALGGGGYYYTQHIGAPLGALIIVLVLYFVFMGRK